MDVQKKIYNFVLDFWKLMKKYAPRPKQSELKVFMDITDEVEQLNKKHDDNSPESRMFKKMILVWTDYLAGRFD